jgi:hypothetical protein
MSRGRAQFRLLRILLLLLILFVVAMSAWLDKLRTTDWDRPLVVALYPINGDGSAAARDAVTALNVEDFHSIETFFAEEAAHWGLPLSQPMELVLGPALNEKPPAPPRERNVLAVMWWSLQMRYWAWRMTDGIKPAPDVRMFLLYHDPVAQSRLAHSLGLQKGLLGVVNVFAGARQREPNNVVIAHEILHTVGASDKYDPRDNRPLFPQGYADPARSPLFPQDYAEIMAGRIPQSETEMAEPEGLDQALIGEATAIEIRWLRDGG